MPDAKRLLMVVSAFIILALGLIHLVYTFWGPKLLPRDAALIDAMKAVPLAITSNTTVWKAWIGYNASHSMALILFGLVYGYLAIVQPNALFGSSFLQLVGFLLLAGLAILGRAYWFAVPFAGISASLFCYVASVVLSRA